MENERDQGRLVAELAGVPGLADAIHRSHGSTPEGRCPVCTAGAHGGRVLFPCRLYELAESARALTAERCG